MSIAHLLVPGISMTACGDSSEITDWTTEPGKVTCFICRKSSVFKTLQEGVETPTPLREVIAEDPHLTELAKRAKARAELDTMRNQRGMFTIKEVIHHGSYYKERYVEVHEITEITVNAVLMSSPYSYGDWLNPDTAVHRRRAILDMLVQDLRQRRENRSIGWSTFVLVKR